MRLQLLVVMKMQNARLHFKIQNLLDEIQKNLFARAEKFLEENTHDIDNYDEFKEIMKTKKGFIKAFWCEGAECEKKIKEETKATTRVLPLDESESKGTCIYCGKEAKYRWIFGQAY